MKNMLPTKKMLCAISIISVTNAYVHAQEVKNSTVPEYKKLSILSPINAMSAPKLNLLVEIPETFKSIAPLESIMQSPMNEFIPKQDNIEAWSEIITLFKYIGTGMPAPVASQQIIQRITQLGAPARVIRSETKNHGNYTESNFAIAYSHKGHKEVVVGAYYSGPYDCSGVQYAIALKGEMTEGKALQKIDEFWKNNTRTIPFN